MPNVVTNEQDVQKESSFVKLQDGSKFQLLSSLVQLQTCYIPSKGSILWDDQLLKRGLSPRIEFFYLAKVTNGKQEEEGIIRLPKSVFYSLNENEKFLGKSKTQYEWMLSKKGTGLETTYSVVRGNDAEVTQEVVDENTAKMLETLTKYEVKLREKLESFLAPDLSDLIDEDFPSQEQ